jgi:hypothetical protein
MGIVRFISRMALFLVVFLALNTILVLALRHLMQRASLALPEGTTTLILGDSHVECALNDTLLPGTVNLSQAGDAYLYSHAKLRALLEQNPGIDTLLLSYNFQCLNAQLDVLTHSEKYCESKLPYEGFLLDHEDLHVYRGQLAFYSTLMRAPHIRRQFIKRSLQRPTGLRDLKIGGFQYMVRDKFKKDLALRDSTRQAGLQPQRFGEATDQVPYLLRTVALCKEKGVTCILVNTPVHPIVVRDSDTAAYYGFRRKHMADIPLLDHSGWLLPDSGYSDATHLSHHGARLYSTRFQELRSRGWPAVDRAGIPIRP